MRSPAQSWGIWEVTGTVGTTSSGPAFVQFCNASASNSCTFTATPTTGNYMIAEAGDDVNTLACGTGWTQIALYSTVNIDGISCYKAVSGDTATVTPLGGTAADRDLKVWEVSGTSLAIDTSAGGEGGTSGVFTTTISPTNNQDIILTSSFQSQVGGTGVTVPSGYTSDHVCTSACAGGVTMDGAAHLANAASGAQSITWTMSGTTRVFTNVAVAVSGTTGGGGGGGGGGAAPDLSGNTVVWQSGNASLDGYDVRTGSNQCGGASGTTVDGGPTAVNAPYFTFPLGQNGTSCGRNQVHPHCGGNSDCLLTDGHVYAVQIHYYDGKDTSNTAPGMGDCNLVNGGTCGVTTSTCPGGASCPGDARALVFQVHPYTCSCSPCTGLTMINGSNAVSNPQWWATSDCGSTPTSSSGPIDYGLEAFTPGKDKIWTIEWQNSTPGNCTLGAGSTCNANGNLKVYDGTTVILNHTNVVTMCCATGSGGTNEYSWWNFGPYKWIWEAQPNDSYISLLNATMTVTYYSCASWPCSGG